MGLLASLLLAQSPVDHVRAKRYAEARQVMTGVAEPADSRQKIAFHRLRAAIASGLGEHGAAADEMVAALTSAPDDAGLLLATAVAELAAGRLDGALTHASRVATAAGAATVGDIQEKRGDFVAAAKAYQHAVELAPTVEAYRVALALELVQHATFAPAALVLEQAAPLFPKSAKIRTLLGVTYYAMEESAKASAALLDAIAVDRAATEPAFGYLAQLALADPAAPEAKVQEALCGWNREVCAALELRSDARNAKAIATLRASQSSVARCALAVAYERQGQLTAARKELETCVELDGSPRNLYRLVQLYRRLDLAAESDRTLERYKQVNKQQSEEAARRQQAVRAFQVVIQP